MWFRRFKTISEKHIVATMVGVALIGFVDATYLAVNYFNGSSLKCGPSDGCNVVTSSQYASLFGIPVALLGSIYYVTVFILGIAFLDTKNPRIRQIIIYLPIIGLLASLWFISAQVFIIDAICRYCMVSAASSATLFVLGPVLLRTSR